MVSISDTIRTSFAGRFACEYPILAFVAVAVAWTWVYDSLAILYLDTPVLVIEIGRIPAIWGPLIGAAVVIWLNGGDLRAWAGQVTNWRVHPYWYVVAFGLPVALGELSALIVRLAGIPIEYGGLQPLWLYVGGFLLIFLTMGALEEFGWRGFAQPILQERYTAVTAGLLIGFVWAVWHYRLFFHGLPYYADVNIALYTVRLITVSLIYAWIYNGTGGSVLLVMIYHAVGNLAALFQPAAEVPAWLDSFVGYPAIIAAQVVIALVLVRVYNSAYLARSSPEIDSATLLGR